MNGITNTGSTRSIETANRAVPAPEPDSVFLILGNIDSQLNEIEAQALKVLEIIRGELPKSPQQVQPSGNLLTQLDGIRGRLAEIISNNSSTLYALTH